MPTHMWGDENFDWKALDEAVVYVSSYCRRFGLLGGQSKEKFGQLRFYANFGHLSLHSIFYPGYGYSQFPKWLWTFDCFYSGPLLNFFFGGLFIKWQKLVYARAYKNACKKWQHIQAEILCSMDYPEFLGDQYQVEIVDGELHKHTLDLQGKIVATWVSSIPVSTSQKEEKQEVIHFLPYYKSLREIGFPFLPSVVKAIYRSITSRF